ncbi:hypothetical protein EV421DRAFT_1735418 [Armillaria borealis]|uniref:Uncharacterized protein n=1 Tax=Armillaria borealis TaxID=47425 RepID=A0AA39JPE8_9AGAR|nr:hypothetical protein EV421DRAFT_1735418 [Armillaria borealis]
MEEIEVPTRERGVWRSNDSGVRLAQGSFSRRGHRFRKRKRRFGVESWPRKRELAACSPSPPMDGSDHKESLRGLSTMRDAVLSSCSPAYTPPTQYHRDLPKTLTTRVNALTKEHRPRDLSSPCRWEGLTAEDIFHRGQESNGRHPSRIMNVANGASSRLLTLFTMRVRGNVISERGSRGIVEYMRRFSYEEEKEVVLGVYRWVTPGEEKSRQGQSVPFDGEWNFPVGRLAAPARIEVALAMMGQNRGGTECGIDASFFPLIEGERVEKWPAPGAVA